MKIVEFLIPITIFITGIFNISCVRKLSTKKGNLNLLFGLFFGLIHGLGFSNYFRMMVGRQDDKLLPLIEFALGIKFSQIIIVLAILIVGFFYKHIIGFPKEIGCLLPHQL